jgi:hypothetical protein
MMIKKLLPIYIVIFTFLLLFIISCTWIPVEKTWIVNGTATFKGTPANEVKFAAFLIRRTDVFDINAIRVSNITNLGTGGGVFSLNLDVEEYAVNSGDRIVLIFWEDSIDNSLYDNGERFEYVEPLPGCPVFKNAVSCLFFYSEKRDNILLCEKGWNVDHGYLISISVSIAALSNAKITNWYSWD